MPPQSRMVHPVQSPAANLRRHGAILHYGGEFIRVRSRFYLHLNVLQDTPHAVIPICAIVLSTVRSRRLTGCLRRRQKMQQQPLLGSLEQRERLHKQIIQVRAPFCRKGNKKGAMMQTSFGLSPRWISGTKARPQHSTFSASGWVHLSGCTAIDSSLKRLWTVSGLSVAI